MDNSNKIAARILDIPHTVVNTRFVDGKDVTKNYPGYYVEVRDENAVYHVSNASTGCVINSLVVARLPIYKDSYNPATMAHYKNNVLFDFTLNKMYVFDYAGNYRTVNLTGSAS